MLIVKPAERSKRKIRRLDPVPGLNSVPAVKLVNRFLVLTRTKLQKEVSKLTAKSAAERPTLNGRQPWTGFQRVSSAI